VNNDRYNLSAGADDGTGAFSLYGAAPNAIHSLWLCYCYQALHLVRAWPRVIVRFQSWEDACYAIASIFTDVRTWDQTQPIASTDVFFPPVSTRPECVNYSAVTFATIPDCTQPERIEIVFSAT